MTDIIDEFEKPDRSSERTSRNTIDPETDRIAAEASNRRSAHWALDAFSADPQDEELQRALDELFHEILSRPRDAGWREIDWLPPASKCNVSLDRLRASCYASVIAGISDTEPNEDPSVGGET